MRAVPFVAFLAVTFVAACHRVDSGLDAAAPQDVARVEVDARADDARLEDADDTVEANVIDAQHDADQRDDYGAKIDEAHLQGILIEAPSRDALFALDLLHLDGLVMPQDHPSPHDMPDGRLALGADVRGHAIATLRTRGCTRSRRCTIRITQPHLEQDQLDQWRRLDTQIDRGDF